MITVWDAIIGILSFGFFMMLVFLAGLWFGSKKLREKIYEQGSIIEWFINHDHFL